jgi:hypothetical protein
MNINGPFYLAVANSKNVDFYKLGPFNVKCKHCPAIHFPEEHTVNSNKAVNEFYNCCEYGKLSCLEW